MKTQQKTADAARVGSTGGSAFGVLRYTAHDLTYRLVAIADDDRYGDEWSEEVLRQSAQMLESIQQIVTTDHETKADFIARVRAVLSPNTGDDPRP